jgi:hypothetical protein
MRAKQGVSKFVSSNLIKSNQITSMSPKFVENCSDLIKSLTPLDGDQARLAHRLSRAISKLEEINALAESVCAHNPKHNFCDDLARIMSEED